MAVEKEKQQQQLVYEKLSDVLLETVDDDGFKQIRGSYSFPVICNGKLAIGYCAMGILAKKKKVFTGLFLGNPLSILRAYHIPEEKMWAMYSCPKCDKKSVLSKFIMHINDKHKMKILEIAYALKGYGL